MNSAAFGVVVLIVTLTKHSDGLKDLGYTTFNCDTTSGSPTNVHEVRPADIKIVAALGDSLSAGYGAGASSAADVGVNYRGLTFVMGGDNKLETHITIPNILKKFNPNLFGQALGTGLATDWNHARLDAAVGGAKASDMPQQARDLVTRIKQHPDQIDIQKDWKLVHIFIGSNDACYYCQYGATNGANSSPKSYKVYLEQAVKYLYDNLPRTIVSIVGMLNIQLLEEVDKSNALCKALHKSECACDGQTAVNVQQLCRDYQTAAMEIQNGGNYEKNDFTVVVQPLFVNITQPKLLTAGGADTGFFAPDCFHFSQYGHAIIAKYLWNNLVQPVGAKVATYNLTNTEAPLACPDQSCPYIRTVVNSKACKAQ